VIVLGLCRYLAAASIVNIFDRYSLPNDMTSNEEVCLLCDSAIVDDKVALTAKGLESLLQYAKLHSDKRVEDRLSEHGVAFVVHSKCRKDYTNKKRIQKRKLSDGSQECSSKIPKTRSATDIFDWKGQCFLCSKPAHFNKRQPKRNDTFEVRTLTLQESIITIANSCADSWATEVKGRLATCSDLVAVEAVYHRSCYCKFHKISSEIGHHGVGRPVNENKKAAFDRMCDFIEAADDELKSLDDLVSIMQQFSVDPDEVY
jgi:hypothetical protein